MRKTFAITDEDGKRWLLDTKGTPIRDTVIGEWVDSKAISFDYLPDLPPIFREMFYFYAGEQRWYNEYRAEKKGVAPSKYWIINRDEVPDIKSFDEFKRKVTE